MIILLLICLILGIFGWMFIRSMEDGRAEQKEALRAEYLQGWQIMMASKAYIMNPDLRYDGAYIAGGYPPDDIGVCTDVVWKGFMGAGINLKDLVDKDIEENFDAYKHVISTPDPNIDFRLVPRLEVFFERNAEVLTTDLSNIIAWQPGDIVIFESSHVAIVSNVRNLWGMPYIIQHGKDPAGEEDRIFASDGMKISGHYRWPVA